MKTTSIKRFPCTLRWQNKSLSLGPRTCIMGVLNVTPDSFSDGGLFFKPDEALAQAEKMVAEGADIIDVGGESTRPFSEGVAAEEEMRRVLPVIEALAGRFDVPIAIDTTKAVVAEAAIAAGATVINDISAMTDDPNMLATAVQHDVLVVLMHKRGNPRTMQVKPRYASVVWNIGNYLAESVSRAEAAGIERRRLVIDPGIGFGKTVHHNLLLMHYLDHFQSLGIPILMGPSRKSFIRHTLTAAPDALPAEPWQIETGTQAMVAAAILAGAHIVRVHDVATTRVTAKCLDAVMGCGQGDW